MLKLKISKASSSYSSNFKIRIAFFVISLVHILHKIFLVNEKL